MKTQLTKPARHKARYTEEYKQEALELWRNSGRSAAKVAAELGIRSDVGLYDLRNRFYSPDLGRFLQPDPASFKGDPTNLYRYCRNNPQMWKDPNGEYVQVAYLGGSIYQFAIPIECIGATPAQIATWNAGSNLWTGGFGGYAVITSVSTAGPSSPTNYVFVGSGSVHDFVFDHQAGLFDANTTTYTAAHEFGHFMYLEERAHLEWTRTYDDKWYQVALPDDPLSSSSIMGTGQLRQMPPTEDDIRNIIMATLPRSFPPIQGPGPLGLELPGLGGGLPLGVGLPQWRSVFSSFPWNTSWSINGWGIQYWSISDTETGEIFNSGWDFITPGGLLPNFKVLRQGL